MAASLVASGGIGMSAWEAVFVASVGPMATAGSILAGTAADLDVHSLGSGHLASWG